MALPNQIFSVNNDVAYLVGSGSLAAVLGFSTYFMSYEYSDFDRINISDQEQMESTFQKRKKFAMTILIISAFVYVSGIVLLTVGISLYRNERENIANSITGIITQANQMASQSSINEPAILASFGAAMVLLGFFQSVRNFHKTEDFGILGSAIYAVGWLLLGFSAATDSNSLSSLDGQRLAWSLSGAALIVASTFAFPWSLHHNYISSPAYPIMCFGYLLFSIGTSFVTNSDG